MVISQHPVNIVSYSNYRFSRCLDLEAKVKDIIS